MHIIEILIEQGIRLLRLDRMRDSMLMAERLTAPLELASLEIADADSRNAKFGARFGRVVAELAVPILVAFEHHLV